MKATIRPRYFLECPTCSALSLEITHLLDDNDHTFGTWYCEQCGQAIKGTISEEEVEIETVDRYTPQYNLVLAQEPFFFVTKTWSAHNIPQQRVYREEDTCPENILNEGIEIVVGVDRNPVPHKLLKFIASVPCPPESEDPDWMCNLNFGELDQLFNGLLSENS